MISIVWKLFFDKEKEEKWLNEMAARGKALIGFSVARYVFGDCEPGEYIYRIDLLPKPLTHPDSMEFLRCMEEGGAETIASWVRWVFFRKKAAEGAFEIYTDLDSKINHYKRIRGLFAFGAAAEAFAGLSNVGLAIVAYLEDGVMLWTNFYLGLMVLLLGMLFLKICGRSARKIKKLKNEKKIYE